jgi:hypothetical protein
MHSAVSGKDKLPSRVQSTSLFILAGTKRTEDAESGELQRVVFGARIAARHLGENFRESH